MRPFWHQEHEVPIERVQQVITGDDEDDEDDDFDDDFDDKDDEGGDFDDDFDDDYDDYEARVTVLVYIA